LFKKLRARREERRADLERQLALHQFAMQSMADGVDADFDVDARPEPGAPSYMELSIHNDALTEVMQGNIRTYGAALRLMQVLCMTNGSGKPVFKLNSKDFEDEYVEMVRFAIMDLNATLQGAEMPPLCLDKRSMH